MVDLSFGASIFFIYLGSITYLAGRTIFLYQLKTLNTENFTKIVGNESITNELLLLIFFLVSGGIITGSISSAIGFTIDFSPNANPQLFFSNLLPLTLICIMVGSFFGYFFFKAIPRNDKTLWFYGNNIQFSFLVTILLALISLTLYLYAGVNFLIKSIQISPITPENFDKMTSIISELFILIVIAIVLMMVAAIFSERSRNST